jgi:uncharacterized protein YacL
MSLEFTLRLVGMMIFALLGARLGIDLSNALYLPPEVTGLTFSLMGALAGLIITPWLTTYPARAAHRMITQLPAENLIASMFGLLFGLVVSALLALPLSLLPNLFGQVLPTLAAIVITYMSVMVFGLRQDIVEQIGGRWPPPERPRSRPPQMQVSGEILLDTSVIIDGRILDISQTSFIQGTLVIPRFVLNELQHVADSGEMLRRNRGKRGLEILGELQQHSATPVKIIDDDIPGIDEVDEKLVLLSQQRNAPVMTNDYNLNRVAEIQGVTVLNINELANALKAIFLPGEVIDIHIVMEGRETDQGVGYLEDGTMVVVENAKRYMDRTIPVLITRYIVTNAGRMYFAQPAEDSLRK